MLVYPLRRHCDPCQGDDRDAGDVPRVDCDCGRLVDDEVAQLGDCEVDEDVDVDADGAFHSLLRDKLIVGGLSVMRRLRLDCSVLRERRARAKSEATPFPGIDGVLDDAYLGRWLLQPLLMVSRPNSPDEDDDGDDGWCDAYPLMRPMDQAPMDWPTRDSPLNAKVHLARAKSSLDDDGGDGDDAEARAYTSSPQRRLHYGESPRNSHPRRCSFRSRNLNHHPGQKILHY